MGAEAALHEHQVKTQLRRCCHIVKHTSSGRKRNHSFTIKNKKRIFFKKRKKEKKNREEKKPLRGS